MGERNIHGEVCTYMDKSTFPRRKQNKQDLFLWTSAEHVRVSFLHQLKWLSTCFMSVSLISCSKILSSQGVEPGFAQHIQFEGSSLRKRIQNCEYKWCKGYCK